MNVQINQLVKSLLQKDSLDECSVGELKQFAERHPYFGAAQLLLTKKLQGADEDEYREQLQKTFLYFHNPLWVEQLLNESGKAKIIEPVNEPKNQDPGIISTTEQPDENKMPPVEITLDNPAINTAEEATEIPTLLSAGQGIKLEKTEDTGLVFEPYYTVDYFASQGIKFKEEEKPKDKFGQQLKSFTDWLKTMKRLPVSAVGQTIEPQAEQKVEQLAQHSLDDREVVTEAMAEVWEKQGNASKAIEIWSKLSLLDPSKSVYFAAKIEELKKRI